MSPATTRKYRVCLHEWDVFETFVEAQSEEHAIKQAEALYNAQGTSAFDHFNGGDDGFTAELVDEEGGR
ncbi:hypothetical protein FM996_02215 [Methylosinus sporium]|uniref:Uncharacterized protein n=1 Tax=Methylosinus sporium TaxID=428 RepID=A0A549T6X9_METSR|nr:hypothetical protein [Methylosinus sporium]TRL37596.1 hypothetical protein FM996_02215 [Methylosinus sporium]